MKTLVIAALALALSGCVHTEVELPNNGGKFSRTSFLSNQSIGKVDVRTPNSTGVTIDSYGNDSSEVAQAALSLALAATKK